MKKIGLVGGMSWVSTLDYYKLINEGVNERLSGLHFAECMIYSVDSGAIQQKTWPHAYEIVLGACEHLKKGGAEALVLCANTAHLFADQVEQDTQLPVISIITETAKSIQAKGLTTVGLLGTKFTMEMDFYRSKLESFGIHALIPDDQETREFMQHVLKNELGKGEVKEESRTRFLSIANELIRQGAEGVILGCTEIPLLMTQTDFSVPVFDTTRIHSDAIVEYMLSAK